MTNNLVQRYFANRESFRSLEPIVDDFMSGGTWQWLPMPRRRSNYVICRDIAYLKSALEDSHIAPSRIRSRQVRELLEATRAFTQSTDVPSWKTPLKRVTRRRRFQLSTADRAIIENGAMVSFGHYPRALELYRALTRQRWLARTSWLVTTLIAIVGAAAAVLRVALCQ